MAGGVRPLSTDTVVWETVWGRPGIARVSTNDQDVAGPTMRLTQAGAIRVFTDLRSTAIHRSHTHARGHTDWLWSVWIASGVRSASYSPRSSRSRRRRAAQLGGEDRHQLGGGGTGLSRVWVDRALRAASDSRADEGWHRRRPCSWQAPRPSASRRRQDRGRAQAGGKQASGQRPLPRTRLGVLDRLSRGQPRGH